MTVSQPFLSLYIHWPFCRSKCPYCDFNSHVRASVDEAQWQDLYAQEIAYWALQTPYHRVRTIFFGGGTPSLMSASLVETILWAIHKAWPGHEAAEISLEANPNSVEVAKFLDFKSAGIQRVSLGVQALREDALRFLGRGHTVHEAQRALEILQKTFDRYSFDLIYARPGQTLVDWRQELSEALTRSAGHLSLYQLTLEEGTPFFERHQRGDWVMPSEDETAALYEETHQMTQAYGLRAYEVSNYARPGQECQHNLAYWSGQDYVGIGPGAHGRLTLEGTTYALRATKVPERWMKCVREHGHGLQEKIALTLPQKAEEFFMMGLRLETGIHRASFKEHVGVDPLQLLDPSKLQRLGVSGLVQYDNTHLWATEAGRQRLNGVLAYLVPLKGDLYEDGPTILSGRTQASKSSDVTFNEHAASLSESPW